MAAFAEGTTVTPERSQMEIAAQIRKYGATSFGTGWADGSAFTTFVSHGRTIRFVLALPNDWRQFRSTPGGRSRDQKAAEAAMEAETRRRWRCLALAIKAKLEAVDTGIATFEEEFLPYTVLPDGRTVSEHVLPQVNAAVEAGRMPRQLLAIGAGDR